MVPECIVFDLDGTLLDTSEGIFKTANTVIAQMGYEECHDPDRFSLFVGPPLHIGFERVFKLVGDENWKAVAAYKKLYRDIGITRYRYYPGMVDMVAKLKEDGFRLAVATLKNEAAAVSMITSSRYGDLFDVIKGSDEAETMTKAMLVESACRALGAAVRSSVLVGDSESDEKGAEEAGMWFIPVSWGFGFRCRDKHALPFASDAWNLYDEITKEN